MATTSNYLPLYAEELALLKALNAEDLHAVMAAIIRHYETGERVEVENAYLNIMLNMCYDKTDANREYLAGISEKRRAAIARRWGKSDASDTNDTNVYNSIQEDTNVYKSHDEIQVNTSDTIKEKKRNEMKYISLSRERETENCENPIEEVTAEVSDDLDTIVDRWVAKYNQVTSLPKCTKVTDKRRRALRARLKEAGTEAAFATLDKIASSAFLAGCNGKGWVASIDWCITASNWVKINEGNYDNRTTSNVNAGDVAAVGQLVNDIAATIAARR